MQQRERYEAELKAFCAEILRIRSTLDFAVSARGWGYILEGQGVITKGDLDAAQELITDCRKSGYLPIDICAVDERRSPDNLEAIDNAEPGSYAASLIEGLRKANQTYIPFSFWEAQEYYVEMMVEKIDLKNLFAPVCAEYHIPIANGVGWNDVNGRAGLMGRFQEWERKGKQCVLLYCGDHDPGGLNISDFIKPNLKALSDAIGWSPDELIIDRFGLNYPFIIENNLTWIDNLETSSGGRLDDLRHKDNKKRYVQKYLELYGARKVEANALVVRPQEGRDLCRAAINWYVEETAPAEYGAALAPKREELRQIINNILSGAQ